MTTITFPAANLFTGLEFRFLNAAGEVVYVSARKAGEASDEHETRVRAIKKLAKLGITAYALANAAGRVFWTATYSA